tara:strand:+ start:57320 stop:58465 length:1146 start_codon:yes stop_codon:yes gene_type:complete
MITIIKLLLLYVFTLGPIGNTFAQIPLSDNNEEEEVHDEDEHSEEESEGTVQLSVQQIAIANIRVATLQPALMNYQVYAPGDIKANDYTSYLVSPRVDSIILRRHVALGDHVENRQVLVTLFSEAVAEAQAAFLVARSERQRVSQLGREAVGENRFIAAQTDYQVDYGRLLAYGLFEEDILSLTQELALGEYTLKAENAGAVLSDDFRQGQWAEAGRALIELADEKELWVEARLAPTLQLELPAGTVAEIIVGGEIYEAVVSQEAHTIDPQTRTRVVRLIVKNEADRLHPGQFSDVYFTFPTDEPVMAVPESGLMRGADGDWTVFVEVDTGQFRAEEVELGRTFGDLREIEGISPGTRVVMEGAFFVASEISKGGFDAHGH